MLFPFVPASLPANLLSVFIIFLNLIVAYSNKLDPLEEFSDHQPILPIFYNTQGKPLNASSLQTLPCSAVESLELRSGNTTFRVKLIVNNNLIPYHYFERIHQNGQPVVYQKSQLNFRHCHFHGTIAGLADSIVALSTFRGSLNGILVTTNETYHVHYNNSRLQHFLFKSSQYKNAKGLKCGVEDFGNPIGKNLLLRQKRSVNRKEPYRNNGKSRYVELVLVNDHQEFMDLKKDREAVVEKSKQIANIVNALYNQLNIFVALVGVEIWSESDQIKLSADGDTTLTNFLRYRKERLVPKHPNDNSQLITGITFSDGVVGKALKGPICTYEYSGGVNTDHSHVISLVATTVAHELGHNFGMEHDTVECSCPEEKCIMAHSSGPSSPRKWSSCSVNYLNEAFARGMDSCLKNQPRSITGPVCGNGFTEDGEECDCGLKDFCDNPCCDAATCKLKPGARCAIGICCDLATCTVVEEEARKVCRKAASECDFAEYCDGKSELCPEDIYVQDGTECGSEEAYCYNGTCSSYNSQCKLLWGSTGTVSIPECFKQNELGKPSGHCGYNRINNTYYACKKSDTLCGMLHCEHLNERLEFGMSSAAILHKTFIRDHQKILTCQSAVIDLGLDTRDPGLVPNGAKCGENKMCLNQKCIAIDSIKSFNACPNDCSGNGLCDNKGTCHCMDGFAPPNCEQPLPRWYHLTLALYIIFLCILPLTAFAAFIAYYFHSNIKTWWILRARKASIKSRAKQATISKNQHLPPHMDLKSLQISNPLPLDDACKTTSNSVPWATSVSRQAPPAGHSSKPNHFQATQGGRSAASIVPARPAPPPPPSAPSSSNTSACLTDQANSRLKPGNISRSTSLRSSSRANLERPKYPPPRPPMDQNEDGSSSESNDSSDPLPSKATDQHPLMNNTEENNDGISIGRANFAARLAALQANFNASGNNSQAVKETPITKIGGVKPPRGEPPKIPTKPGSNNEPAR